MDRSWYRDLGYMAFTLSLFFVMHVSATGVIMPHLFETRLYDVCVGGLLGLAGTRLATYPHFTCMPAAPPARPFS
jgi:hypothetical protein